MKIIGKSSLWEGRFLRSVLIKYLDPGSAEEPQDRTAGVREWETIERVNCSGIVAIVPFTDRGEVVMIRQFRPPVNGYVIELPAGLCDIGESLEVAAKRELLEETGYTAARLDFLIKGPLSSGSSSEMLTVFSATGLTFTGIGKRDETESIEVLTVPLDELPSRLSALQNEGNYIDLKVHGLVWLARNAISVGGLSALDFKPFHITET